MLSNSCSELPDKVSLAWIVTNSDKVLLKLVWRCMASWNLYMYAHTGLLIIGFLPCSTVPELLRSHGIYKWGIEFRIFERRRSMASFIAATFFFFFFFKSSDGRTCALMRALFVFTIASLCGLSDTSRPRATSISESEIWLSPVTWTTLNWFVPRAADTKIYFHSCMNWFRFHLCMHCLVGRRLSHCSQRMRHVH